jgi:hypothetical protein
MRLIKYSSVPFLLALLGGSALPALADEACLDFKWDVSRERALFAEPPAPAVAAKNPASAPIVVPKRLYAVRLAVQDEVAFSVTPGKKAPATPAYAGLLTLKIPAPGSYRIAVDLPFWIDVVSHGVLVAAKDYQGQHACGAPHKIVEFDLVGVQPFVLQISNAATDSVLLTVTPSPLRKF